MSELPEQVHIAGPVVTVGSVRRQRCTWCGGLIDELDLAHVAVPADDPRPPAMWDVGVLVLVSGTAPRVSSVVEQEEHPEHPGVYRIPENSCMALDPDVTR